ncbi:MAG: hypothetical protein WD512_10595 [Candidatus Paceibacterota bacterium]
MANNKLNQKKGVAGLNIFLSIIAMIFLIGIIVMVFAVAGTRLTTSIDDTSNAITFNGSVTGMTNTSFSTPSDLVGIRSCKLAITSVHNNTEGGVLIGSGNYTTQECGVKGLTDIGVFSSTWHLIGTYTYNLNSDAVDIVNATTISLRDVPDWFPTFIVLGAMVVLILLVVIIITSIRGSGITGGGSESFGGRGESA